MKKFTTIFLLILLATSCQQRAIGEKPSPLQKLALYFDEKLNKLFNEDFDDHHQVSPYSIYGMSLDETGEHRPFLKTLDSCYTALETTPNDVALRVKLGMILYDKHFFEDATEQYALAIEADSTYLLAYYQSAVLELNVRSNERAIELLEKATAIDPLYVPAYELWGTVLLHEKKYEQAMEKYDQAISLDSTLLGAYEGKILIYTWTDRHNEATALTQQMLAINWAD